MDPSPSPSNDSAFTVQQCCQKIRALLESADLHYGHGAINAESEALWIVSKQLCQSPAEVLDQGEAVLSAAMVQNALHITHQRIQSRQPLAYLLGEAWLMGVPFECSPQSIVPRSFIAELIVSGVFEPWLPADGKVLDLCTGNGSLAILTALHYPDLHIVASDLSLPALALAARNLDRHQVGEQIELLHGDLWEPIAERNLRFDVVICNPPYVNEGAMQCLPPEYLAEPRTALAGGQDGMDLIHPIIQSANRYLNERGAFILEIGNEYDHFQRAFPHIPVIWLEVAAGDRHVCLIQAEDLPR
jgi:ribosomal protein L3 glutamine methyltransferase